MGALGNTCSNYFKTVTGGASVVTNVNTAVIICFYQNVDLFEFSEVMEIESVKPEMHPDHCFRLLFTSLKMVYTINLESLKIKMNNFKKQTLQIWFCSVSFNIYF